MIVTYYKKYYGQQFVDYLALKYYFTMLLITKQI